MERSNTRRKIYAFINLVILVFSIFSSHVLLSTFISPITYASSDSSGVVMRIDLQNFPSDEQEWSIIKGKSYYYLNDPIEYEFLFYYDEIEDVRVSYSVDDYDKEYACERIGGGESSSLYECILPPLRGMLDTSLFEIGKIPINIKLEYKFKKGDRTYLRSKYFDAEVNLESEPSEEELYAALEGWSFESKPTLAVDVYNAEDGNAYCKLRDLGNEGVLRVNVSTNYFNPYDFEVYLEGDEISYEEGGSIKSVVSSSCALLNTYAEEGIFEYVCEINDIDTPSDFILCSGSAVDESSLIDYESEFVFHVVSGSYSEQYSLDYSSFAEVSRIYDSLEIESSAYWEEGSGKCYQYEGSDYCTVVNEEEKSLEKMKFYVEVDGIDPGYAIETMSLSLKIDNRWYGEGEIYYGSCELDEREGMKVKYYCEYYLPLREVESLGNIEYRVEISYYTVDGEEGSIFVSDVFSDEMELRSTEVEMFYFVDEYSFDAVDSVEMSFPLNDEGSLSCVVNPSESKCYFGEDIEVRVTELSEGESSVREMELDAPFYVSFRGEIYSNVLDVIGDEEEIFRLYYSWDFGDESSGGDEEERYVSILKSDCTFEENDLFKGRYVVKCYKDLSGEFEEGIPYDPDNPPKISLWLEYAFGEKSGEKLSSETISVFLSEEQEEMVEEIAFEIYEWFFSSDYITNILAEYVLSSKPPRVGYPVCRIPVAVSKILENGYGECEDEYVNLISALGSGDEKEITKSNAELLGCIVGEDLEAVSPEDLGCEIGRGLGFVGKIKSIYNKTNINFLKMYYKLGEYSEMQVQDMIIAECYNLTVEDTGEMSEEMEGEGEDVPIKKAPLKCEDIGIKTNPNGQCYLADAGEEDAYYLACYLTTNFKVPLSDQYILSLQNPTDLFSTGKLEKSVFYITVSVEDNGYLRNGSDKTLLEYYVENSYAVLKNKLNSWELEKERINSIIDELNKIYNRLWTVIGVIGLIDLMFGSNPKDLGFDLLSDPAILSPRGCVVGCIGHAAGKGPGFWGEYTKCVTQAFVGPATDLKPWCLPIPDIAFKCATAGAILISNGLDDDLENYADEYANAINQINNLQRLMDTGSVEEFENAVKDLKSKYNSGVSGDDVKDSVIRGWAPRLFSNNLGEGLRLLVAAVYGGACINAIGAKLIGGGTSLSLGEAILWGAGVGAGTGAALSYVATGSIEGEYVVSGAFWGGLGGAVAVGAESALGALGIKATPFNIATFGALTSYILGKIGLSTPTGMFVEDLRERGASMDGFASQIGLFLFTTGVSMAVSAIGQIASSAIDCALANVCGQEVINKDGISVRATGKSGDTYEYTLIDKDGNVVGTLQVDASKVDNFKVTDIEIDINDNLISLVGSKGGELQAYYVVKEGEGVVWRSTIVKSEDTSTVYIRSKSYEISNDVFESKVLPMLDEGYIVSSVRDTAQPNQIEITLVKSGKPPKIIKVNYISKN